MWDQIEPTPTHLTLLIISGFLVVYALCSFFIRNHLQLSEPPLAILVGIIFGPRGANLLTPVAWGLGDNFTQELTRIILCLQCFTVGVSTPQFFFRQEWKSIGLLLGPVMTFGWVIVAILIYWIFHVDIPTALTISACLTPTDPILAAALLAHSTFSQRIPLRIRNLLAVESACNDGTAFPFLYVGLAVVMGRTAVDSVKRWVLVTMLWQCLFGILLGVAVGQSAYLLLRKADSRRLVSTESYLVFHILLALFCTGLASLLGVDDFLVAFSAGAVFAQYDWFTKRTADSKISEAIDLQLNTAVFVYLGASIPWATFEDPAYPYVSPGRLTGFLVLVLLLRRLPVVLAIKPLTPALRTYREALLVGHFGPMGVGALFLAIEARAQLETDTSLPLPVPPQHLPAGRQRAVDLIWPIVTFIVLGSTFVHGLSPLLVTLANRSNRGAGERQPLLGADSDHLADMEDD